MQQVVSTAPKLRVLLHRFDRHSTVDGAASSERETLTLLPNESMPPQMTWEHLARPDKAATYAKDEAWILASMKSHADWGDASMISHTSHKRPQTVGGVTYPASLDSHPSMPSLRIRDPEKNPITGCLPSQVAETRDWTSTTHSIHRRMYAPKNLEGAGSKTRFGYKDGAREKQ